MAGKKVETALQELALAMAEGRAERANGQLRALPRERMMWVARGGLRMALVAAPFIKGSEWQGLLGEFGLKMDVPLSPLTEEEVAEVTSSVSEEVSDEAGLCG